jgi:hypothetical protein
MGVPESGVYVRPAEPLVVTSRDARARVLASAANCHSSTRTACAVLCALDDLKIITRL